MNLPRLLPGLLALLTLAPWGFAAEDPKPEAKDKSEDEAKVEERSVAKEFELEIPGQAKFGYTATAGTILLRNDDRKPTASVFYVAYTRKLKENDLEKRPLLFAFNGGPGSSSIWLHLGALGPRVASLPPGGVKPARPPYTLAPNPHSLLDLADLVFIDPVGTGFSRVEKAGQRGDFHGVDEDVAAVADFMRLYATKYGRWASPKYIIGESYGAVRAAGLADRLQEEYGMYLNGIMLLSGLLDFSTILPADNNDLPYVLFLPSMTATAFYHKKLSAETRDFDATLKQAEQFARGEYSSALFQGNSLDPQQRVKVGEKLAAFTGLSVDFVQQCNLRVSPHRFMKELLREEGKTVGRLDGRVLGADGDLRDLEPEFDPSMTLVMGPYATLFNDYISRDLKFDTDLPYQVMGNVRPWKYPTSNAYVSVAERLASAMRKNPHLQVHVSCGYYDLATPYYAIVHSIDHLKIDTEMRGHFTIDFYQGGHMMYTNQEALKKLKADLHAFIARTLSN